MSQPHSWLMLLCILLLPTHLFAESQSLEQAANDPTASLMSVQLQNLYVGDYHKLDDEHGNTVLLRVAIPHKLGGAKQIARATLPMITDSPSGKSGVGDLVVFDMVVTDKPWGRYGIGAVMLAPTASKDELGAEKWAMGPAMGFVVSKDKLLTGLFNQNLFSFAGDNDREDVNISIFQPIINYKLPNKWSIGSSEMNVTYDWENSRWSALPLGLKLSKLHIFGHMPIQFSGSYEYNFADDQVSSEWTINFTAKFLFPI